MDSSSGRKGKREKRRAGLRSPAVAQARASPRHGSRARPGHPAEMNEMTPTWMWELGKGPAGPFLGEGLGDLVCFPTRCDAESKSCA